MQSAAEIIEINTRAICFMVDLAETHPQGAGLWSAIEKLDAENRSLEARNSIKQRYGIGAKAA